MKITHHTQDQLILDQTPWMFGLLFSAMIVISVACITVLPFYGYPEGLLAIPFLVVGLILFAGVARRDQAIFDRTAGTVTLRHRNLAGYQSRSFALADVDCAEVDISLQTRSSGGARTKVFRPAIRVKGTLLPLSNISTNSRRHHAIVETINAWLSA